MLALFRTIKFAENERRMDTNNLSVKSLNTTTYQNELHRLYQKLLDTSNLIQIDVNLVLDGFDLTLQQFNALQILKNQIGVKRDISFSTNDLRDLLLDKMSDTSRLVDRLVIKELIHKKPCDMDGRRVHLTITEKGMKMLAEVNLQMSQMGNKKLKLTEIEARQIYDLLDKML